MLNFCELIKDIASEKGLQLQELFDNKVISEDTFYDFSKYIPSLSNIIKVANYTKVSIDYMIENTTKNNFRRYKTQQSNFYDKVMNIIKPMDISQSQLAREIHMARNCFSRWKNGVQPRFSTIIDISKVLGCKIDDLLETECD